MYDHIGIVTGLLIEADAFAKSEGTVDNTAPFSCRHGERWSIACGGIGKVHATMAAQYLATRGCDLLVSLGVAGALDREASPGAYWLTHALQHDYGAARASGFVPFKGGTMPLGQPSELAFPAIDDPGTGLQPARIVTGDCFVEDPALAARLSRDHAAHLVDMESAAIAQVAAAHGIGFAGIRSVSDGADGDSARNFQLHLERAARTAATAAQEALPLLLRA